MTSDLTAHGKAGPLDSIKGLAGGYRAIWKRQEDWEHIASGL
jgi:hypothetical protein